MLAHSTMSSVRYSGGARFSLRAATKAAAHDTRIGSAKTCGRATRKVRVVPHASTAAINAGTGGSVRSSTRSRIATEAATENAVAATSPAHPKLSYSKAMNISVSHSGDIHGAPGIE